MSNGRYTYCPFYIDENKRSISCEDVCRHFSSTEEKNGWMRMYCDSMEWMECPFAADLNEAYYQKEKGDEKALETTKIKSQEKEIRSLSTKLGKAEKKIERCHVKYEELHKKWREADEELTAYKNNVAGQIQGIVDTYETRLAYLMDTFTDGELDDADVDKWLGDKSFAIVYMERDNGEGSRPYWKVVFEEDGETDDDRTVSRNDGTQA